MTDRTYPAAVARSRRAPRSRLVAGTQHAALVIVVVLTALVVTRGLYLLTPPEARDAVLSAEVIG